MLIVKREKAKELLDYLDKNFPEIKIAYKDEPYKNLTMKLMMVYVFIANLFIKDYKSKFESRYITIAGDYIYFPSRLRYPVSEYNLSYNTYIILRHEIIHLIQRKKSLFFSFNYIFLLPSVFTMRSVYEFEAYQEQMVAIYELFGEISDSAIEQIAENFHLSMYFWMYPFKAEILARLKKVREKIYKGEIKSKYLRVSEIVS